MCSSSTSCSYQNVHQKKPFPIERRPTMLKDFLNENSSSCSSSGFKSFPRKPELDCKARNPNNPTKLQRSRSKAASTTISAFHSIMNAVKAIQFTAVKTPSLRSLSRRLSSKRSSWSRKQSSLQTQVQISVKVKDILRWTSFRDERLPQSLPWDFASSTHRCTTVTDTTTTTTTCSNSSNGSSWCDSDFTAEFLPSPCHGENDEMGKKYSPCVGRGSMESTAGTARCIELDPKVEVLSCDEDEQHSPVSVLEYQFGEDDEDTFSTSFDQSLANVERTKEMLMQRIKQFEGLANLDNSWLSPEHGLYYEEEAEEEHEIEEKAMEMLNYVKETSFVDNMEDKLLLDFIREEMGAQRNDQTEDGFDWEIISKAKAWISTGENVASFEWGLEQKKEAIVRDMHKGGKWINKFEDEQEDLALEIQTAVLGYLVDELSVDLSVR